MPQPLVEQSLKEWKEVEYEVTRLQHGRTHALHTHIYL